MASKGYVRSFFLGAAVLMLTAWVAGQYDSGTVLDGELLLLRTIPSGTVAALHVPSVHYKVSRAHRGHRSKQ